MSESTPPPLYRGGVRTHDGSTQDVDETVTDVAHALVTAAVTSKLAAELGCPRLAVRAARQATATAARLTILLSADVARTPPDLEAERLDGVTTNADLCALLGPDRDDRGGPT